jgi:hypothetical protein
MPGLLQRAVEGELPSLQRCHSSSSLRSRKLSWLGLVAGASCSGKIHGSSGGCWRRWQQLTCGQRQCGSLAICDPPQAAG